jgi:hypothetical protein
MLSRCASVASQQECSDGIAHDFTINMDNTLAPQYDAAFLRSLLSEKHNTRTRATLCSSELTFPKPTACPGYCKELRCLKMEDERQMQIYQTTLKQAKYLMREAERSWLHVQKQRHLRDFKAKRCTFLQYCQRYCKSQAYRVKAAAVHRFELEKAYWFLEGCSARILVGERDALCEKYGVPRQESGLTNDDRLPSSMPLKGDWEVKGFERMVKAVLEHLDKFQV